jgi:hypothetical protein
VAHSIGSRALNVLQRRKISYLYQDSNPGSSAQYPSHYADYAILARDKDRMDKTNGIKLYQYDADMIERLQEKALPCQINKNNSISIHCSHEKFLTTSGNFYTRHVACEVSF